MKLLLLLLAFLPVLADVSAGDTMKASEFRVRDPYVVPCPEDGLYHLFISDEWSGGVGVSVRTSSDLRTWSKPRKVLTIPESWKIVNTWAPEVHRFKDKWYIFVTLGRRREDLPPMKLMTEDADFLKRFGPESFARRRRLGTYVFRSDELDGPYEPVSEESLTPVERMALDGTLWVEDGKPYMMFSWDWPQLGIGECALAPLKDDLSAFAAEPKTLFKASIVATNAWKANVDGPFLHRSEKSGKLFAIWSTTGVGSDFERGRPIFDGMKDGAYSVILCESASGRIGGPWINHRVIYSRNGGHGMFFKTFDGRLVLAIHQPEKWFSERAAFFSVEDRGDSLEIGGIFEPGFSKRSFVVPPSECSPGYFWMWNAKLDAGVIRSQLDEMYSNGLRSVCIHPFPKGFRSHRHRSEMSPDYLTDGFMEAYKAAIDHAEKLGMSAWLYDEGGWPSGGACGQVARQDTEGRFRQRFIREGPGPGPEMIAKEYAPGQDNVPSLVEKGATEKFIELTHERYAKTLGGHLGKTVRFAFTDEPDHPHDRHMAGWAVDFADEFKRRKGYDIMPFMAELLARRYETVSERLTRVRIDYHEVMGDLFVERFLLPVRRWCHEHGILSAGHFNGEDVPEFSGSYGHGALLKSLRALDVPGVDVIWRQLFPASLVNTGRQKPFPRYAASAAHQNGGMQVLSESFGIYGDSMSPDEMKWLVDFQMVRGVNLFVFGYYAMSYAGQWMSLLEPHSGPVVPYWEFQRPFFDYIARTSAMLSQGRPDLDVAVLYDEKGFRAGGVYAEMAGERHYSVSRILDRMNCEFEFVDEGQIEQARIEGGRLVVGAMKYATVVLPSSRWMGEAARGKLADFRKAGGKVLGPDDLDGIRPSMRIKGPLHKELRVCKRRCGVETLYFIVNESHWAGDVTLVFDEPGEVVRCDTETGSYVATGATDGKLDWHFPRFGSAMFIVGAEADKVESAVDGVITNSIDSGWTVRGIVRHKVGKSDFEIVRCEEKPVSVELGDWRSVFGRHFSGKAEYRTSFVSDRAGRMTLDLGRVCWSCRVRLNGKEIGKKFFGPYRFVVDVEKGVNVLEITVANLLANALSDDETRDRIARDFPPLSSYDRRQRVFDGSNNESGLFGPVKITGNGRIE